METKQLLSRLNAKEDEIKKLNNEIKHLKSDLVGRNFALANSTLKEKFSELIQNISLHELLTSLSQLFQQIEFRYHYQMEEQQFKKLEEINKNNRLMLQDFIDKYLLYNIIEIDEFLLDSENLCKYIKQYASVLEELSEHLQSR